MRVEYAQRIREVREGLRKLSRQFRLKHSKAGSLLRVWWDGHPRQVGRGWTRVRNFRYECTTEEILRECAVWLTQRRLRGGE